MYTPAQRQANLNSSSTGRHSLGHSVHSQNHNDNDNDATVNTPLSGRSTQPATGRSQLALDMRQDYQDLEQSPNWSMPVGEDVALGEDLHELQAEIARKNREVRELQTKLLQQQQQSQKGKKKVGRKSQSDNGGDDFKLTSFAQSIALCYQLWTPFTRVEDLVEIGVIGDHFDPESRLVTKKYEYSPNEMPGRARRGLVWLVQSCSLTKNWDSSKFNATFYKELNHQMSAARSNTQHAIRKDIGKILSCIPAVTNEFLNRFMEHQYRRDNPTIKMLLFSTDDSDGMQCPLIQLPKSEWRVENGPLWGLFQTKYLIRTIRLILFGSTQVLSEKPTHTGAVHFNLWGLDMNDDLPAGLVIGSAIFLRYALSPDTEFAPVGRNTAVDYWKEYLNWSGWFEVNKSKRVVKSLLGWITDKVCGRTSSPDSLSPILRSESPQPRPSIFNDLDESIEQGEDGAESQIEETAPQAHLEDDNLGSDMGNDHHEDIHSNYNGPDNGYNGNKDNYGDEDHNNSEGEDRNANIGALQASHNSDGSEDDVPFDEATLRQALSGECGSKGLNNNAANTLPMLEAPAGITPVPFPMPSGAVTQQNTHTSTGAPTSSMRSTSSVSHSSPKTARTSAAPKSSGSHRPQPLGPGPNIPLSELNKRRREAADEATSNRPSKQAKARANVPTRTQPPRQRTTRKGSS
ncbi:hypothetical protein FRC14_001275 [Serendipita sp. 396]|nr:hypothetical protein FRC14_001275 [Serendipita sp. 396]KAG8774361.1 hypothetical protein FRC15_001344 [Serendipita sp. 397]KAG8853405.1 hypothetical protein FRC20_001249 [Serendipita sp. 405]